jgi:catechol 2,3-dioxygenase-like lactoylglutathione lyase family enzyme
MILSTATGTADPMMKGRLLAFSHLGLSCFDMGRMEQFYTQVLGLTVSDRAHLPAAGLDLVFMTTDALEFFVDSPWFIHQPCGEPFDLSASDDEILAHTEAFCREQPGFEPYDSWRARMSAVILADQARIT